MRWRFTLSHSVLGSHEISEPGGWKDHKIKWTQHPSFFSLVESLDVQLTFYGTNTEQDLDGGIDFINQVEQTYGFNARVGFMVELAEDDVNFDTYFQATLPIHEIEKLPDNTCTITPLADNQWAKLLNRYETPVNLSDNVDLDGNAVAPVGPVFIKMTSQTIRKTHYAVEAGNGISVTIEIGSSDLFIQYTPGEFELDEMEDFYHLTPFNNPGLPVSSFDVAEEGTYVLDIQWTMSAIFGATENHVNNLTGIFLKVNDEDPIAFSGSDQTSGGIDFTVFTLQTTLRLLVGDAVRIYAEAADSSQTITYGFWGKSGLIHGPFDAPTYSQERPAGMDEIPTYTRITADTIYPETEVEAYLIHDLFHAVCARIGVGEFYSEHLGGLLTQSKQYDDDGCGWRYAIVKGLQLRGYPLSEKPFFISLKQIWEGINPILNLGLGYEELEGDQVIRVEEKDHFVGSSAPVNFSNVRQISYTYDTNYIFKTIRLGYSKWQSEDISGIDDPQTKQVRATPFTDVGTDIAIESHFIAAGIAIETTRRKRREKAADYKYDNDNFVITLNTNDVSPDVYEPELDENFASITGLLNESTRYNLMITPLRNLYRWLPFLDGCMQLNLTSPYKFVSGEGNYDMQSQANLDVSCDRPGTTSDVSESDDVLPSAFAEFYFLPKLFDITIPMDKSDFDLLDRKRPIGISQSDSGHVLFQIKELEYDNIGGEAMIKVWPKAALSITVPEQEILMPECSEAEVVFDSGYQSILDYADTIC